MVNKIQGEIKVIIYFYQNIVYSVNKVLKIIQ